jgi:hypothetical protein
VLALLFGLGFYSFVLFFFGEANTVADGFIFVCAGLYAGNIIIHLVDIAITPFTPYMSQIVWRNFIFLERYWGTALEPISNISRLFTDMIGCTKFFEYTVIEIRATFAMFFVWGTVFAACAYGYFHAFIRKGAEKAGEISDSPFGYKTFIPLYAFGFFFEGMGFGLVYILIFALMFIAYVIYRRGLKLKESDIFVLFASGMLMLIAGVGNIQSGAILLVLALVFFAVSLCRLIGAAKENRERAGTHSKGELVKRAVLLGVSVLLLVYLGLACVADIYFMMT